MSSKGYSRSLSQPTRLGETKYKWKAVEEAAGDVFCLPKKLSFEWPERLDISLGNFAVRQGQLSARYNTQIRESYELGYLFGTFLGDGHAFLNHNGSAKR